MGNRYSQTIPKYRKRISFESVTLLHNKKLTRRHAACLDEDHDRAQKASGGRQGRRTDAKLTKRHVVLREMECVDMDDN